MPVDKQRNHQIRVGIVGAGPAGSLLAYLLAKEGYDVHLVDRFKNPHRKVCGEYLCPKGVELLDELKLSEALSFDFKPLNGMVLVTPKNETIPSYFPKNSENKLMKGIALNRQIFDQRLLDLAIANGAQFTSNFLVKNVVQDKNRWKLISEEHEMEFDFLVSADGRQSKIARLLGHSPEVINSRVAIHCYLPRKSQLGLRMGEMHIFSDGSYCGLDPISDDEVNFSIVCDSKTFKMYRPIDLINKKIAESDRLSSLFNPITESSSTEIKTVTALRSYNNHIAGNKLAYVGDAAGFIDPLTGEGIYNALLSSKILAESILKNKNLESALQEYKAKKIRISRQKNIVNHFFQFVIKSKFLINLISKFLRSKQERANHFIGIVGNIHNPMIGLLKMIKA